MSRSSVVARLNRKTGHIALARWALACPGYYSLRLISKPGSRAEIGYHQKRRATSLSSALGVPVSEVESSLREVQLNQRIASVEAELRSLPYSGVFRGAPELYAMVRIVKPRVIVETGVGIGYSSSYILEALAQNGFGQLTSIDQPHIDPSWNLPEGRPPGFLVAEELRRRWNLVLGRTRDTLPSVLKALGNVDVFLHDSEHSYETMKFEYEQALGSLVVGGLLVSDDAMWNTALLDFARERKLKIRYIYHRGGSAPFTVVKLGTESRRTITR